MTSHHPLFLLQGGRLVREGGPRQWLPLTRNPEESAARVRGAAKGESVYLYDVDGVEAHAPNLQFYQRLERDSVPMWVQPGARNAEDAMDAFFAGAESLTVEMATLGEAGLRELADLADGEIHVAFSFRARSLEPALRPFELHRLFQDLGLAGLVLDVEPGADLHQAGAVAGELRRHGIPLSLLLRRNPQARSLAAAVDRVVEAP